MKIEQMYSLKKDEMSKPIQFRAWDKFNACMYYSKDSLGEFFKRTEELEAGDNGIVWMQYTGLKDKSGKDIYVGDIVIVKLDKSRIPHIVYFSNGGFRLKNEYHHYHERLTYIADNEIELQIIGNIYENLEFLDQKKLKGREKIVWRQMD